MKTLSVSEVSTQLEQLLEEVSQGHSFAIERDGKLVAQLVPYNASTCGRRKRIGFLAGVISVPDDFDDLGRAGIVRGFEGEI